MGSESPHVLRYEVKSVLPDTEAGQVRLWLRVHPAGFRRAYPPRIVNSLYFDTPGQQGFHENLSGAARRRKLRLRWYGRGTKDVDATLELKCKEGLLGWKETLRLPEPLSPEGLTWRALRRRLRVAVTPRFRLALDLAGDPALFVRYRREYLVSASGEVRATVDTEVIAVDQSRRGSVRLGPAHRADREIVLEVKADEDRRAALERVLAEWPVRISRNSKFARGLAGGVA